MSVSRIVGEPVTRFAGDPLQQSLLAVREQLAAVDLLATALERTQVPDVQTLHRQIRSEVEVLEGLTEKLFGLCCLHDGIEG